MLHFHPNPIIRQHHAACGLMFKLTIRPMQKRAELMRANGHKCYEYLEQWVIIFTGVCCVQHARRAKSLCGGQAGERAGGQHQHRWARRASAAVKPEPSQRWAWALALSLAHYMHRKREKSSRAWELMALRDWIIFVHAFVHLDDEIQSDAEEAITAQVYLRLCVPPGRCARHAPFVYLKPTLMMCVSLSRAALRCVTAEDAKESNIATAASSPRPSSLPSFPVTGKSSPPDEREQQQFVKPLILKFRFTKIIYLKILL